MITLTTENGAIFQNVDYLWLETGGLAIDPMIG